jgi:hypothetical protein
MSNDAHWARWDDAVEQYAAAMLRARTAERNLKASAALRYKAYKSSGQGVEDAKQSVLADADYLDAWQAQHEAEVAEKVAKLRLDELQMRFSEWQSRNATRRVEMSLR